MFVFLTRPVVGLVAGVCNLSSQLQVVSGLVIGRAVSTQRKHAAGEAGQVAHLPLQVSILPLANESQAAVGFAYQVALNGLEGGSASVCERAVVETENCLTVNEKTVNEEAGDLCI